MTLGGPVLRYSGFAHDPGGDARLVALAPVVDGLVVATVKLAAGMSLVILEQRLHHRPGELGSGVAIVLVTGPVGFYLTWAGFFHAMQVLAMPAGFALPDSFRWPFGRPNISEFWANWNMTAVLVCSVTDLFFNRWGGRRHYPFLNVMILFSLVGLWHAGNAGTGYCGGSCTGCCSAPSCSGGDTIRV